MCCKQYVFVLVLCVHVSVCACARTDLIILCAVAVHAYVWLQGCRCMGVYQPAQTDVNVTDCVRAARQCRRDIAILATDTHTQINSHARPCPGPLKAQRMPSATKVLRRGVA